MPNVTLEQKMTPKDTFLINQILGLGVSVQDHVAYVKTTRAELARETKVSTKTVTRKLQQFGELELISFSHKKGHKGGLVIELNPERFRFDTLKSPLTNPTKKETNLVNRLFPAYNRKRGIRRTKTEMAEYRETLKTLSKQMVDANNVLEQDYIGKKDLDWAFFERLPMSNEAYQIWLLSRVYDAMVEAFEGKYLELFAEGEGFGYQKRRHSATYRSLDGMFIGSNNYKSFQRLIEYGAEEKMNPVIIMNRVFDRYLYTHETYGRKATIPVPNQLIDKNGKRIYKEALANLKETKLRFQNTLPLRFHDNAELFSAYETYTAFATGEGSQQFSTSRNIINAQQKVDQRLHFYSQAMFNIRQQGATEAELGAIDFYLNEQFQIAVDWTGGMMASSQVGNLAIKGALDFLGTTELSYEDASTIAIGSGFDEDRLQPMTVARIQSIAKSLERNQGIAQEVSHIENQRWGIYYSITEIRSALTKFRKYIPVGELGMLKFSIVDNAF